MKFCSLFFATAIGITWFTGFTWFTWTGAASARAGEGLAMTEQLRLWEGPAPHAPQNPGPEVQAARGRVSHVSVPTLDVYLPDPAKATGRAVLICSGGGYRSLASGPLGEGAARIFLPKGIAVFSLKYRLQPPSTDVRRDAAEDGRRAMRIIRSRAAQWHLDPKAIGMVGFSAGSNLILNLVCAPTAGDPASADPIERQSARPDFIVLCAAWPGGQSFDEFHVTAAVPPAFLLHARDDKTAPFSFAEQVAAAWGKSGVPVRLEPYDTGGHMAFNFPWPHSAKWPAADWPGRFLTWLDQVPGSAPKGAGAPAPKR